MYCNCPSNLKSLDLFSSKDLSILDKISLSFIETFVLWRLVSAKILYSGKEWIFSTANITGQPTFFEGWISFLVLIGSAWLRVNLSFCVSQNFLFLLTFLSPPWWHWNRQLPKNKYGVPVRLIWFSSLLFSQHMKGDFYYHNRLSDKNVEKNVWIKFWYIFENYPAFCHHLPVYLPVYYDSRSGRSHIAKGERKPKLELLH